MVGFFFQFPFANGVERWWGVRFGGGLVVLMTAMAMGWKFAVAIAQWTMELLLGAAHASGRAVAWVDDGVLPGVDAAAGRRSREQRREHSDRPRHPPIRPAESPDPAREAKAPGTHRCPKTCSRACARSTRR